MLTRQEKIELIQLLEEKERRRLTRKLFSYYPDTGPLRRELYQKHLQFFEAGSRKIERLFLAANRIGKCIAGDTLIESPYGDARQVKDIKGTHWVWAWDGNKRVPAQAEAPFVKPSEMVYRVFLRSGQFVDCAAEHRFLSEAGWIFLSDLFASVPCLPGSSEGIGPSMSLEDARCLMNKHPDSLGDYHQVCHLNDEQLLSDQDNDRVSFPSRGGVLKRNQTLSRSDDQADKCKYSLLYIFDRLSIQCEAVRLLDLFAEFLNQARGIFSRLCPGLHQEFRRLSIAEVDRLQSIGEASDRQDSLVPALITPDGLSDSVVCYQPIGVQPIYDFHVPYYKNYCTAGMIHHNTEGAGGYELTLHLTGLYPEWWNGKRFSRPIQAWAAGDTSTTVRDIIQEKLWGKFLEPGTGLIPKDHIIGRSLKRGLADAIDTINVRHVSGGVSQLVLKSYDQRRESFQGTKIDVIWLDEEMDIDIYTECLLRTTDTTGDHTQNGIIMLTFTPLMGMSETVMAFLPGGQVADVDEGSKFVVMASWDDCPHLSKETKELLWNSIPPFQRDARSKGVPQLGAGAIYPIPETDLLVDDFQVPPHWPRGYALDVGWNRTAAGFYAWDRDNDCVYRIGEHYRGEAEPSIHAQAIKARGDWLPGVIDPASRGRSQQDGRQLLQMYIDLGLNLETAANGVESGIYEVWQRMSTGRFKVFRSCQNWLFEFRLYRRDEKGKIIKTNDHAMDEMRYFIMSGLERAKTKPIEKPQHDNVYSFASQSTGWMG